MKLFYITLPETSAFWGAANSIQKPARNAETPAHSPASRQKFTFNPKIPVPVEVEGNETEQEALASLTLEKILSSMIKTLTHDPSCRYQNYYRRFIRACKPHILKELTTAALVKADNGDLKFACEIAGSLAALFPKSAKALYTRALILEEYAARLRQTNQIEAARDAEERTEIAYREALSLNEPLTAALFSAGFFYYKQKKYAQALEHLRNFLPLTDDAGQKEPALLLIRQIETEHLDDVSFAQARDAIENGREEEGVALIRAFLKTNAEVWNAHFLLGLGLRRLKRWEGALAAFQKARELGGDISDTNNEIAICLIELGRPLHAKQALEKALLKDSENVKILSNLAIVELKLGNAGGAAAFFRTVLEYSPNDPIAARFLSDIHG